MEVVATTGAIGCAKLQSNHHHQQTNTQFFYRPDAFLSPNTFAQDRRMAVRWPGVATISLSILTAIFQVNLG